MTYIFALRSVTDERLLPQLEAALREQPELGAREQLPQVWRGIDKLELAAPRAADAGTRRRRLRYRTLGAMLLLLGALLVIPELFGPRELSNSLIVGLLALAWGAFTLTGQDGRPKRRPRLETAAQRLLHMLGGLGRYGAHAIFAEDALAVETPDGERETLPYDGIACVLETGELLFLLDASRVITLQKSELSWGEWEEFHAFLAEKTKIRRIGK